MTGAPVFLFLLLAAFAAGIPLALVGRGRARWRPTAVAATLTLPLLFLALFASLAVHMHRSLGGWPERIGDDGFPSALLLHDDLAGYAFSALILGGMFAWPLAVVLCAAIPRMRPGLRYLGLYSLATGAALLVMQLAPGPFLNWWWD
ncbi:MAG: hypothetical protein H8E31_10300 [Planctomycetes bacterium]|nr:hypothetical protein [Planctomycetota bacterium]